MDLQTVSNINIPQGEVRTIHDKNNRLLWGRVNYDVSYKGNSTQQTYSGVNLFNVNDGNNVGSGVSVDSDGFITVTYDNTSGTGNHYENYFTNNLNILESTNYVVVAEVKAVSGSGRAYFTTNNQVNTGYSQLSTNFYKEFSNLSDNDVLVGAVFTRGSYLTPGAGIRTTIRFEPGQSGSVTFRLSVLADTTITPGTFTYQPFVGGIPAPNPQYPQDVHVVTGEQTVTVSDGANSQSYTVDLGAIELCKIGDYQDYIYKSGDDWYVHKAIGKYVFNGSENWVTEVYGTNSWKVNVISIYDFDASEVETMCDFAKGVSFNNRAQSDATKACVCYTNSSSTFFVRNTNLTSQASVQTATTGKNLYYKATPTNTKITGATLVAQLNAIHNWVIRYGYSVDTVVGDLPIVINREELN